MDDAHLGAATVKQATSCCLRGADQNDQRQQEDGNPRRCVSQIMQHRTGSKKFPKLIPLFS